MMFRSFRWRTLRHLLVIGVLFAALFIGVHALITQASACSTWYRCPVTQYFGQNQEHGTDFLTHGLPITPLLAGVITFDAWECWSGECVQDITWRLDNRSASHGQPYAYVQIRNSRVRVGQHVSSNTVLGYSSSFMEYGLTPDKAYGVSNWRWGINPLFVIRQACSH